MIFSEFFQTYFLSDILYAIEVGFLAEVLIATTAYFFAPDIDAILQGPGVLPINPWADKVH